MLVVPADAHIDPARDGLYARRPAHGRRAPGDRLVRDRGPARHARRRRSSAPRRSTATSSPRSRRARRSTASTPIGSCASRRSRRPSGPRSSSEEPGVAWNAGIFLWQRRAIRAALGALHRASSRRSGRWPTRRRCCERAYESIQRAVSIDYAVMEGAARTARSSWARWTSAGPISGRGRALLAAIGARGEGVGRAARRDGRRSRTTTSSSGARTAGSGVIAPPERGSMTAAQPIAVLRGAAPDRDLVEALIDRCADRRDPREHDQRRPGRPRPSSSGRTAGAPGSPTTSRSRTSAAAPTVSRT